MYCTMISRPKFLRWLYAVIVGGVLFGAHSVATATELIMFRQDLCEWCEVWDEEVGIVYAKTREGQVAPLRNVDIHEERPRDLTGLKPVVYTPTFVLLNNGVEVGRIYGYPGENHFWGLLNQILEKLPADG